MSTESTDVELEGNIDYNPNLVGSRNTGYLDKVKMTLTLSNVNAREWFQKTREGIKPWMMFLNTSKMRIPKSISPLRSRVVSNIDRFQSNYLFVFLGLILFCILTSPMLLFAIAACLGACYIIRVRNKDTPIKFRGHEVSLAHQYAAVGIISFPIFWLAGAGSAVFWVIGASMFVVMLHASLYMTDEEVVDADTLTMEELYSKISHCASMFVVMLHASLYMTDEEVVDADTLIMEEV